MTGQLTFVVGLKSASDVGTVSSSQSIRFVRLLGSMVSL
jgi:hypothetical protein